MGKRPPFGRRRMAGLCALLGACLLLWGACAVLSHVEKSRYTEKRSLMSDSFGVKQRFTYQGQDYVERQDLTALLLIGVDQLSDTSPAGFRQGGQADFLLLCVLDHENEVVRTLHIDRDAVTQVVVLGVLGNEVGARDMQICLAHGFGDSEQSRSQYTVRAVRHLLQGAPVTGYLSADLDAIPVINDALGGVEVTLDADFTAFDAEMRQGATLTLNGQQALWYVRLRREVGEGTNLERMARQRAYLIAALQRMRSRCAQDGQFLQDFWDQVENVVTTGVSRGRLINELNRALNYDVLPIHTLEGIYAVDEAGFMAFYPDQAHLLAWVMEAFYKPAE